MKSVEMYIRMVLRRKIACALVVLFTAAATVFLLVYPQLIEETRLELEVVYDSTTVITLPPLLLWTTAQSQ